MKEERKETLRKKEKREKKKRKRTIDGFLSSDISSGRGCPFLRRHARLHNSVSQARRHDRCPEMSCVRLVAGLRIAHASNNSTNLGVLWMQAFNSIFSLNTTSIIPHKLRSMLHHAPRQHALPFTAVNPDILSSKPAQIERMHL